MNITINERPIYCNLFSAKSEMKNGLKKTKKQQQYFKKKNPLIYYNCKCYKHKLSLN